MAYFHRFYTTKCGKCETNWLHSRKSWDNASCLPISFRCDNCQHRNATAKAEPLPDVPRLLYCGHEKHKQLEVYAYPPDDLKEPWALPFSVRSFLAQASRQAMGCDYTCSNARNVLGEPAYRDYCHSFQPDGDWVDEEAHTCHVISGWTKGEETCELWDKLQRYCQTDPERKFLRQYLSFAKGRNFPMLIPQPRIGIAERRRPDFVVFVPLQYYKYNRYAIELDGGHSDAQSTADKQRDSELAKENYTVLSLRPSERGYFEEVQKLVERIDSEMSTSDTQEWENAIEIKVLSTVPDHQITDADIPF